MNLGWEEVCLVVVAASVGDGGGEEAVRCRVVGCVGVEGGGGLL